jgi:chromosome segregation ATPase
LETKLVELGKQQQNVAGQQSGQGKRIDQLAADLKAQQGAIGQFDGRLDQLASEQKSGLAGVGKLQEQLKGQAAEIEALKKKGDASQAVRNLEQDLLVLRSELDNRAAQNNTAEFDAFRAQVTRNINALQAQVQNLQQQLNSRP